jgi:hypothetical protein
VNADDSTWQPAHPSGRTSRPHQRASDRAGTHASASAPADASGPLVTHQVVIGAGEPGLADLAHQPDNDEHQGGLLAGLRFVSESPGSLRDQIEYAREGAYTNRVDGPWRNANIWFARLGAYPGLTVCYFWAWAFCTRLSRAMVAWPVLVIVMWLLLSLPVTQWFVRGLADFLWWIAGPDPSAVPMDGEQ